MRILLAVDGSACSEAAVQTVADGFNPVGTHVRIIHAVEWLKELPLSFEFGQGPTYAHDIMESRTRSFEHATSLVMRIQNALKDRGFDSSVLLPDEDPRHAIVRAAEEWPADLIVLGSHGRRGLDRLLIGSVADAVLRHSRCSVYIVRTPAEAARSHAA